MLYSKKPEQKQAWGSIPGGQWGQVTLDGKPAMSPPHWSYPLLPPLESFRELRSLCMWPPQLSKESPCHDLKTSLWFPQGNQNPCKAL